jgi:DNA-binding NarL/FixJ family response regulator
MVALLRRADFEVVEAGSATEAMALLREDKFDLLLTDIVMPDDQNLGFLEEALALEPSMAVVVMTGYASIETAIRALRQGAVDYLQKPFGAEQLVAAIERGLESSRATRAARGLRELAGDLQERMATLESALQSAGRVRPGVVVTEVRLDNALLEQLSGREREIVLELHVGKTVNEVAKSLVISVHTVRNHVKSAFKKLGVHSQAELLERVRTAG